MNLRGFTLIEVMVVVVVITILAAIAIPSYSEYVSRSRRAVGKSVLTELAQFMERYYTENGKYVKDDGSLVALVPSNDAAKYYDFSFDAANTTAQAYVLKAAPKGAQVNDKCGTLILKNTGAKDVSGAASGYSALDCW